MSNALVHCLKIVRIAKISDWESKFFFFLTSPSLYTIEKMAASIQVFFFKLRSAMGNLLHHKSRTLMDEKKAPVQLS